MGYCRSAILEKQLTEINHGSRNWFCTKLIGLFMNHPGYCSVPISGMVKTSWFRPTPKSSAKRTTGWTS